MHSRLKIYSKVIVKSLTGELKPTPFRRHPDGPLMLHYDEITVENFRVTFKDKGVEVAELPVDFSCDGSKLHICGISGEIEVTMEPC